MKKHLVFGIILLLAFMRPVCAELPSALKLEFASCSKAYDHLRQKKWGAASKAVRPKKCPLTWKLVTWNALRKGAPGLKFKDYVGFIEENPMWPWESVLLKKAEALAQKHKSPQKIVSWFKRYLPKTPEGATTYIKALKKLGKEESAQKQAHWAWVNLDFSKKEEKTFYKSFKRYLGREDHRTRIKHLLRAKKTKPARRLLKRLSVREQIIFRARLDLLEGKEGADMYLKTLSKSVRKDPEVQMDYLTWLRATYDPRAYDYFLKHKKLLRTFGARAWKEGNILIRRAFEKGDYATAYKLASHHGFKKGLAFSEAEWIQGWVALRFLNHPRTALRHFETLYKGVKNPISRSRAAYWAGRAEETLLHTKTSRRWYKKSAQNLSSYYGQLAAQKIHKTFRGFPPQRVKLSKDEKHEFEKRTFVKISRLLDHAKMSKEAHPFLYLLYKRSRNVREKALTLSLAQKVAPNYHMALVKSEKDTETFFVQAAYPKLSPKMNSCFNGLDPALVHAVIRKESSFNPQVISSAGAMGLMQLRPETAKEISGEHNLPYKKGALIEDPAYNVKVGCRYLTFLLDRYGGSRVLALAAYNAGYVNVDKWLEYFGDPREKNIDKIDWIEQISFSETRNYIQRVLEDTAIYGKLLKS